ncbi:MAG: hypothetical protein WDO15_18565 [Bacteroidota bacterium]
MKRNRWRVDPKDEGKFWASIKSDLIELSNKTAEEAPNREQEILYKIVHRYASEIAGNFKPSKYRMARSVTKFWFARLLNGARVKKFGGFFRNEYKLRDKIHIVGKVRMLRKLATRGTVVMVPTHFSKPRLYSDWLGDPFARYASVYLRCASESLQHKDLCILYEQPRCL